MGRQTSVILLNRKVPQLRISLEPLDTTYWHKGAPIMPRGTSLSDVLRNIIINYHRSIINTHNTNLEISFINIIFKYNIYTWILTRMPALRSRICLEYAGLGQILRKISTQILQSNVHVHRSCIMDTYQPLNGIVLWIHINRWTVLHY